MRKKISLITGVAGTIGSNLASSLIKQGHLVYGIDNLSLGTKKNLKEIINDKNFSFFNLDLSEDVDVTKFKKIKNIDYLWLLAANSDIRAGLKDANVDLNNTFLTTVKSLNGFLSKLNKNSKVFFSSSSAIYGNIKKKLNENHKNFFPISSYGESKLLSEIYLKDFCKKNKINYIIGRFPNVVGKPFTHGVIFDLANKIKKNSFLKVLGNGKQQKPYVHVIELINCIEFLIFKKNKDKIYLIGPNDNGVSVKKITKIICKYFNYTKKVIFGKNSYGWVGDVPKYSYDTKRLNNEGFRFKLSSSEAIALAVKERYSNNYKYENTCNK